MKRLAFQIPRKLTPPTVCIGLNAISVKYNERELVRKSFSWLKDHSIEHLTNSGQKSFSSGQCSDKNLGPLKCDMIYDNEWKLVIKWPKLEPHFDGIHQIFLAQSFTATYSLDWLLQTDRIKDVGLPPYILWPDNKKIEDLHVGYDELLSPKSLHKTVNTLYNYGLIVVKECPTKNSTVEDISLKFGPLYNTFYGQSWDVKDVKNAINVAYTAGELGLHMDLMYFKDPPGLQILHCLKNSEHGGENMFSDAFKAASALRDVSIDDKTALDILNRVDVNYEYRSVDHWMKYSRPVVQLDSSGDIEQVSYSPPFQGILYGRNDDLLSWYSALNVFERQLSRGMINYKLQEGEAVVFINNRITHGRRAFKGDRHLRGAYVGMSAFLDTWRNLNWT
eukprot:NODE_522_length_7276_cov_0.315173.p2 type:complete len:392 gc:universal NODE_522_length_7276_cov_0.315173:507-1682(+)